MDEHEQRAILRALDRLPADQRRAAARALLRLEGKGPVPRARALEVLGDLIRAQARTNARRTSDARTDSTRRTLVGARLAREEADRYRAAAAADGVSLYAWVAAALRDHYAKSTGLIPPEAITTTAARITAKARRSRQDREQQPRRYRPPRRGT